jgi:uncharacterized OB-fold protein
MSKVTFEVYEVVIQITCACGEIFFADDEVCSSCGREYSTFIDVKEGDNHAAIKSIEEEAPDGN